MAVVYLFFAIYLSFMYYLNIYFLKRIVKAEKPKKWIDENYFIIWLIIIVLISLLLRKSIPLSLPKKWLSAKEYLLIILFTIPFIVYSRYNIHPSRKGILSFTVAFPLGEELLFRGIIPFLIYKSFPNALMIPFPLLKEISISVLLSALLFSFMHLQYFNFKINKNIIINLFFAFVFGIFIGNLVEITESVLYSILFHMIANIGAAFMYQKRYKNGLHN